MVDRSETAFVTAHPFDQDILRSVSSILPEPTVNHAKFFCLVLSLSCALPVSHAVESRNDKHGPNVLFLICDDLNCDLGCYGHLLVQSPNIDRLAQRGVRYDRAYCQYPICGPSRASFMSGLYPDQTLIRSNGMYLREGVPNVQTMSQMFRRSGYFATRIGKIYHYNVPRHIGSAGHDDPYSWNYTINPRGRDKDDEHITKTLIPGNFGGTLSWLAADGTDEEQTDGIAATEAVDQLKRYAREDRPFFLAVGLYRPHTPFVAPKKYFDLYPREEIRVPSVPQGYLETLPKPARVSLTRKKQNNNLPDATAREIIQAYYASITFADAQIGRILDALNETGLADNTIVMFTSDHGYHMGEHGHYQKTTLFENGDRVPLIIAGPGVTAHGTTSASHAEMIDFYPTLAEMADLKAPKWLSGTSLVPTLSDATATPRKSAFTQYATGYSLRTEQYRYTEWGEKGHDGIELYDHESDPNELTNLAGRSELQEIQGQLSVQLRERIHTARTPPAGIRQIRKVQRRRVPAT